MTSTSRSITFKKLSADLRFGSILATTALAFIKTMEKRKREEAADDDDDDGVRQREIMRKMNRRRPGIRADRRLFDHYRAYDSVQQDFLAEAALFSATFKEYFRLSRSRVQWILEALANSGDPYYKPTVTIFKPGSRMWNPSLEARVLLPLKTLAFGVAQHCFCDYFQMSTTTARTACRKFNTSMALLFKEEFLRVPSAADLTSVTRLHEMAHGVEGMLGSLDCMHTVWKNCPMGWQQSFRGKEKASTIVLEAVADHYLWFWHASFGYGGALNDLNILKLSPLMKRLTNGTFTATEEESGVTPFNCGTFGVFDKTYLLVDGIYPPWSRFVRGEKEPYTEAEKRFTAWQEGARKDVERSFGVLQSKWKAVASPIHHLEPRLIGEMMTCCLILHNMGVCDRVMGDVNIRYDPGSVPFKPREVIAPHDALLEPLVARTVDFDGPVEHIVDNSEPAATQKNPPLQPRAVTSTPTATTGGTVIGITNMHSSTQYALIREKETLLLEHKGEWLRLREALIKFIDSKYPDPAYLDTDDESFWDVHSSTDDDSDVDHSDIEAL